MLAHRLRRWPNINPALVRRFLGEIWICGFAPSLRGGGGVKEGVRVTRPTSCLAITFTCPSLRRSYIACEERVKLAIKPRIQGCWRVGHVAMVTADQWCQGWRRLDLTLNTPTEAAPYPEIPDGGCTLPCKHRRRLHSPPHLPPLQTGVVKQIDCALPTTRQGKLTCISARWSAHLLRL